MARAPWDHMAHVYRGSGDTVPYQFRGTISCRFVLDNKLVWFGNVFQEILGYVTYFSPLVIAGPTVVNPPVFGVDVSKASILEDTVTGQRFTVLARQRYLTAPGGAYFRAWLLDEY